MTSDGGSYYDQLGVEYLYDSRHDFGGALGWVPAKSVAARWVQVEVTSPVAVSAFVRRWAVSFDSCVQRG